MLAVLGSNKWSHSAIEVEQPKQRFYLSFGGRSTSTDDLDETEKQQHERESLINYALLQSDAAKLEAGISFNGDRLEINETKFASFKATCLGYEGACLLDETEFNKRNASNMQSGVLYLMKKNDGIEYKIISEKDNKQKSGIISKDELTEPVFQLYDNEKSLPDAVEKTLPILVNKHALHPYAVDYKNKSMASSYQNSKIDKKRFGEYDRVRLPTKQDGYKHGLSESAAIQSMANYKDDPKKNAESTSGYDLRKNNCADAVFNVLQKAGANNLEIKTTGKTAGIRNPNIRLPIGSTMRSYFRQVRAAILNKTIKDPELKPTEKIQQVLDMEIMRLEDGIYNIKHNSFLKIGGHYLRHQELKNKEEKLEVLKGMRSELLDNNLDDKQLVKKLSKLVDKNEPVLAKGVFRAKTYSNLSKLVDTLSPKQEAAMIPRSRFQ